MTDTTQQDPRDIKLPNECDFEQWYVTNAFDYVANPLGSMQCGLMRKAWHAATAARDEELARLREQVIQQQTRIVMMRNALLHYSDIRPDTLGRTVVLSEEGAVARNALATTDDLSALKAHDYALIEKCAEYAGSLNLTITSGEQKISLPKISQYIAAAIRSLKR